MMTSRQRDELRELALGTIGTRHLGARIALEALDSMRKRVTPETLLDLIDDPMHTAEEIAGRIATHARDVDEAIAIANAVALEKGPPAR